MMDVNIFLKACNETYFFHSCFEHPEQLGLMFLLFVFRCPHGNDTKVLYREIKGYLRNPLRYLEQKTEPKFTRVSNTCTIFHLTFSLLAVTFAQLPSTPVAELSLTGKYSKTCIKWSSKKNTKN